ncbi:MAG: glycosyltransferase family 4 protein [Richelia sp. RM2_1_2]|nr:glycosyltransferase family 4 protein [Richelia sp. RM2_1_2]
MTRKKILFYNLDGAGVNYYRTLTPATQLERDHSDKFDVEINPEVNFNDPNVLQYLKKFDIIHYHRFMVSSVPNMLRLANDLKKEGVTLIVDIDDYWHLDPTHPMYHIYNDKKTSNDIVDNLKIADYVTTTTDVFASEIRKVTKKDNVFVLPNAVNPEWMKQFKDDRKPDPDGLVRITYMAGSSHMNDLQQMIGVTNMLNANQDTKGKFKMIIAGWDTEGTTNDVTFNQEFGQELQKRNLWTPQMIKSINKSKGNVDLIEKLPQALRDKYRGNVFFIKNRSINSSESIYLAYEKILTNNYAIITDEEYKKWLTNYERNKYVNEGVFARRWTQKANIYAEVLNETDISIAPLADNMFNRMKSNLKQVECWSRRIPIVCTDIPPYNVDGVDDENCLLIPWAKNNLRNKRIDQDWAKALRRLILSKELRERIGNGLYETFKEKYNLKNVTDKRAELYMSVAKQRYNVVEQVPTTVIV